MKKLPEAEIKKYHPIRLPSKLVDRLIDDIFRKEPQLSIIDFYKTRDEKEKREKEQENLRRQAGVRVVKKKPIIQYKCINLPIEQVERLAKKRKSLIKESGRNTTWEIPIVSFRSCRL